jgi:hypothetical protein
MPWRVPADREGFEAVRQTLTANPWAFAYVAPRGIGPTAWDQSERKQIQHQRRFYLLGQTLDAMRVWDIRRAIQTVRVIEPLGARPLWLQSNGRMAGNALFAALYEPDVARLDLHQLPVSHRDGPILLNVQRYLDVPQAVAMVAQQSQVVLYDANHDGWQWPRELAARLQWNPKQLQFRQLEKE